MSFSLPTLHTERLTLRPVSASDAPALFAIFGDERVMRYWSSPPQKDLADAVTLVEEIATSSASGSLVTLGIERRADRQVMGTCTLHARHVPSRRGELGYALGANYWGQGYMHEALTCFLRYLFDTLDVNRLEADIDPANLSSARTLERLGFEREGYLPERWIVGGAVSDSALYGLLARRWRSLHDTVEPATLSTP
jgi:RimJ/RimL family protein N-acetyltransferase